MEKNNGFSAPSRLCLLVSTFAFSPTGSSDTHSNFPYRASDSIAFFPWHNDGRHGLRSRPQLQLTEIKVVPLAEWQTNHSVLPLWHLVSNPKSAPIRFFPYGRTSTA